MTAEQKELWERIQAYEPDDPRAAVPFSARLARDNGWSEEFAERVVAEYRRFAFLAVAAGHPVSPSDAVDQAWHLHLLYTRVPTGSSSVVERCVDRSIMNRRAAGRWSGRSFMLGMTARSRVIGGCSTRSRRWTSGRRRGNGLETTSSLCG
jgi:hypothetical protein